MTKEIKSESFSNEPISVEVSVKHSEKILTVHSSSWDIALAQISIGTVKARISGYANESFVYDTQSRRWTISLDEKKGKAGDRIALTLLFHYPQRVSREVLVSATGIKPDSLVTYLSKSKPEISDNIDETDKGLILNEGGLKWAIEILQSLEK